MLGDGLVAFKLLPALIATILVSRHGLEPEEAAAGAPSVRYWHKADIEIDAEHVRFRG